MLTNDKNITTPEYWAKIYEGKNNDAKVDASNTVRPANPFDRFAWVAQHAEGPNVLDIASGHAHSCKRIKAAYPDWYVVASDQTPAARNVANFSPYMIFSGYDIPFPDKKFTTIIISQALEYFEDQNKFMREAMRVSEKFLCTIPIGQMEKWSQLHVYNEKDFCEWIKQYGEIEFTQRHADLFLIKLKFNS